MTTATCTDSTYWNNQSPHQARAEFALSLVPLEGEADRDDIEVLRRVANAYYDYFNNGWSGDAGIVNDHRVREVLDNRVKAAIAASGNTKAQRCLDLIREAFEAYDIECEESASSYGYEDDDDEYEDDEPIVWVDMDEDFEELLEELANVAVLQVRTE